jgi:hypothetical protein
MLVAFMLFLRICYSKTKIMKRTFIYLLPALILLSTGCLKSNNTTTVQKPSGTFVGEFRLLRKKTNQVKIDTLKANIQVVLTDNINYQVTGDTATVHAGSKGTYGAGDGAGAGLISFIDTTYPKTGKPAKTHLSGTYQYYYDGTKFQMAANSSDTLSLQYDLKRKE